MPAEAQKGALQSVGKYDLLQKIAEGGVGSVYKGQDQATGEIVAVKIVSAALLASNDLLLKRFEQEFRVASSLNHPHLVRALDFGQEKGVAYLVMEFVEGETLADRIEREGRLGEAEAVRLIVQVSKALAVAHGQGIIHRDVKPGNVLIACSGQAKLADLGLAKDLDSRSNLTRTGRGLGTPHFMAPEQFRKAKHADARVDVYSLAATLYMAITGKLPFAHDKLVAAWTKKLHNDFPSPRKLLPTLSGRIDRAIRRAMSGEPSERPASCQEFIEDLTGRSAEPGNDTSKSPAALQSGVNEKGLLHKNDEEQRVLGLSVVKSRSAKQKPASPSSKVVRPKSKRRRAQVPAEIRLAGPEALGHRFDWATWAVAISVFFGALLLTLYFVSR